jgi:hypothetical protein
MIKNWIRNTPCNIFKIRINYHSNENWDRHRHKVFIQLDTLSAASDDIDTVLFCSFADTSNPLLDFMLTQDVHVQIFAGSRVNQRLSEFWPSRGQLYSSALIWFKLMRIEDREWKYVLQYNKLIEYRLIALGEQLEARNVAQLAHQCAKYLAHVDPTEPTCSNLSSHKDRTEDSDVTNIQFDLRTPLMIKYSTLTIFIAINMGRTSSQLHDRNG